MKLFKKLLKSKSLYVVLSLIFQLLCLILLVTYFSREFLPLYYFMVVLSVVVAIYVINRDSDTSSKILWVFTIMALPFFGGLMYVLFGGRKIPKALMIQDRQAYSDYKQYALQNFETLKEETTEDPNLKKMIYMCWNNGYFPVYENTEVTYYETGQEMYKDILHTLRQAKSYIFIETYILDKGHMWDEMEEILIEKIDQGVDVRLMYDDFGSILNVDKEFAKHIRDKGIKTHSFNPIRPQLAIQMNNRDHRKIIVVDGKVAFTGGSNIADEYINQKNRFGYWKDMGIRVRGAAVEQFVIAFLQIWNYSSDVNTPYEQYILPRSQFHQSRRGYVIPIFDAPTDTNNIGKNVHLNMLAGSRKYCWVSTPYLVLDSEIESALILSVNNGVDVRIIVPGIPDKKTVYEVTKSNYRNLLEKGVRIYEYKPGFIHGKVTVSDGKEAFVGTVNMDFRSYYHNYECGVWMYETDNILDIQEDFEHIFEECHEVTLDEIRKTNPLARWSRSVLRIFSPLL